MQLTYVNGIFNCICTYNEKDYPKSAGFVWDKITPKTWATKDAGIAYKLIKVANKEALEAISLFMKKATENMEASRAKDADVNIPCNEGMEYLGFQKAGIHYASNKNAVLIADEQGLGKTIQALGYINLHPELKYILIISPASLKGNWIQEARKWLVNDYKMAIVSADAPWPNSNIYCVNYDILVQPCPMCRGHKKEEKKLCPTCSGTGSYTKFPQLYDMEWDLIIADEIQRIKAGKKAKSGNAFLKIRSKNKIALTGTPIMNRPIEIQSTLEWLDKNTWGNRFMFGKRYCNLTQGRFGFDWSGASNLGELQTRLRSSLMIRRLKADVLTELPPKFHQIIELPSEGLEQVIDQEWQAYHKYESFLENLKAAYQLAKASESDEQYHQAVDNLRQGQNAAFTEMALIRKEVAIKKLPYVIQHLKDCVNEDHKVVAFVWHHCIGNKLVEAFTPNCVLLTGDTPVDSRQGIVNAFQTNKDIHLFVGNMKAAGVGITLTASSHVCLVELDWCPSNIAQAIDRLHRIGQKDNVLAQYLVLEGSLDAVMAKRIIQKQAIITKALDAPCDDVPMELELLPETDVATAKVTRKEVIAKSVTLTDANICIIHTALKMISALCNYAVNRDNVGFSKMDTMIGHSLVNAPRLSQKQSYIGLKLCLRYHKQLPEEIQLALKGMEI